MDQRDLTARQFGDMAANYLSSAVHATGADLDRLVAQARRLAPARALDLGCGAGHVSFALARAGVPKVIAYDLSQAMLDVVEQESRTRGYTAIEIGRGPAERLAFDGGSFDLIATRYSAHHWYSVTAAVSEMARVLKPGGRLIVIDVVSPASPLLDTMLQTLEVLRDRSHVRNYRLSEWLAMLHEYGFRDPHTDTWRLSLEFMSWVRRIGTPERRVQALHAVMDELPREVRDYFAVTPERAFQVDAAWIEVCKPSEESAA
jgi:ubiquinone/menaquinone biosynthesis C-methylase UbiE